MSLPEDANNLAKNVMNDTKLFVWLKPLIPLVCQWARVNAA